ncbi:MAG: DUF1549 domain-containing protein [Myxococcota bacterium]
MKRLLILAIAAMTVLPLVSLAQSPEQCAPTDRLGKYRFLRQVTLDLYGRPPTVEEYEQLHGGADVDEAKVDEMLASPEFFERLAAYHRGFLWTALPSNGDLFGTFIEQFESGGSQVWSVFDKQIQFRGAYEPCLDMQHTNYDTDGRPLPMQTGYTGGECEQTAEGCNMDGWVEMSPYWNPDISIRVCAFDAQEFATGLDQSSGGAFTDCTRRNSDPGCGCGPGLRYCAAEGSDGNVADIREALTNEPARIFEGIIKAGRPYTDAFSTNQTYFNGALRHYYRYLRRDAGGELSDITDAPYTADWELIERPEHHSGILTTMGYLLRHTSQRARVNRLYTAFLCDPFVAPAGGLPSATDPCSQNPDLSERCGCAACHTTIEPATTYFGRWEEGDFNYRADMDLFRENCATCEPGECSNTCRRDYVTRDLETEPGSLGDEAGKLLTTAWRTPEEAAAIDKGPSGLFEDATTQGKLASCAVQNFSEFLFSRELTTNEKGTWLPEQVAAFGGNNYDFIEMAKAIVLDPRYRRID